MIMSEIRKYFLERKVASLQDVSLHIKVEPDAMRGMLDHWVRKGKVKKVSRDVSCAGCGGCRICSSPQMEFYQWIG